METEENVGQEEMDRRGYWCDPIPYARNKRKKTVFIFLRSQIYKVVYSVGHGFKLD